MREEMRVLVIANNAVCANNSNGKVMRSYLRCFSDKELFSFFIDKSNSAGLDQDHFFCVDDHSALASFRTLGIRKSSRDLGLNSTRIDGKGRKKNAFIYWLRYVVWNSGLWKTKEYKNWVESIKPTHVCLMLGNNPYLYKLSRRIASKTQAKLVVFAGEDYPLKNYDYFRKTEKKAFFFRVFQHVLRRECRLLFHKASLVVFNSKYIAADYSSFARPKRLAILYQPSDMVSCEERPRIIEKTVLYAGNLGVGRLDALLSFSDELLAFDPEIRIRVFSKIAEEDLARLKARPNIEFCGFVSNEALREEIDRADVLVHIESFDEYSVVNLRNAFSAKIADMICSNRRILMYAPMQLAETRYFLEYLPLNVAVSRETLAERLEYIFGENYDFDSVRKIACRHMASTCSKEIRALFEEDRRS